MDWPTLTKDEKDIIRNLVNQKGEGELKKSIFAFKKGIVIGQYWIELCNARLVSLAIKKDKKGAAKK